VHEAVNVAGSEDEAAAELQRIFAQLVLAVAAGFGALAGFEVVFAEEMQKGCLLEFQSPVGFAVAVNQQREFDARIFAKGIRVIPATEADGDQPGAFLFEFLLVVAQLRDMLTAEDSSIVAEEYDDRRAAGPERAQSLWLPVGVGQGDGGQLAAEGCAHG